MDTPSDAGDKNICVSCGLCCSGVLFDRARAAPNETAALAGAGLEVTVGTGEKLEFRLPCPQLHEKRCSIYERRFDICRTFVCRLLAAVQARSMPLIRAKELVEEAHKITERIAAVDPELRHARARINLLRSGPSRDRSKARLFLDVYALERLFDRHFRKRPLKAEQPPEGAPRV